MGFVPASQLSAYPGAVFRAGYMVGGEEGLELEMGSELAHQTVMAAARKFRDSYVAPNLPSGATISAMGLRDRSLGIEVAVSQQLADSQVLDAFPQNQWVTYLNRHFVFQLQNADKVQEGDVPQEETIIPAPGIEEPEPTNGEGEPPTNGNGGGPTIPPPTVYPPPGPPIPTVTPTGNGGGGGNGAAAGPVRLQLGGAAGWAAALVALGLILANYRRS